ncbi:Vesicle-trafficking SEC22a [Paramuricea clavata]|uniref:Vesicle-trafficking SEC22a n=1 Tax=Paramuricea clavata TaxID=317549 RepID=A0A6S7GUN2_PARCT|nr:Vesicle-trafficking SEC22a [Paramuricea clavata]
MCSQTICVVLMYILTLHSVMASFGYNDVFEDEMIEYEKRQLVGGETAIPEDKLNQYEDLQAGINKAEAEILNEDQLSFDKNSLQATSQVVQGTLYRVKVDVQPKSCSDSESCNIVKHCSFEIWSRVWLSEDEKLKIQNITCTDA